MVQQILNYSEKTNEKEKICQEEKKTLFLKDIASIESSKISVDEVDIQNYISTENMIPNLGGVFESDSKPLKGNITSFKKNDILISNIRPYLKKIWYSDKDGGCSSDVLVLRALNKEIDKKYLFYILSSDKFINYVMSTSKGTKMPRGDKKAILKFKVPIKNIENQKLYSNFLTIIDKKIELLEKNLNAYQKYYEFVSNNYFENLVCDNILKLKDIISKGKAGGTPKSSNKSYYGGEIPFLSINDMTKQGKYIYHTTKRITEEGLNNSSAWIVPKNSLLYSIYASIGFVSINRIELATSQAIYGIILKEDINQDFIYHYLRNFKRHIYKYIETGTQGNLNSKIVNNIQIKLPSDDEQKTYAEFFNKFEEIIDIKLNEIDKLKEYKKGLLQKMFV